MGNADNCCPPEIENLGKSVLEATILVVDAPLPEALLLLADVLEDAKGSHPEDDADATSLFL